MRERSHRCNYSAQNLAAQHRAVEVDRREQNGLAVEELSERYGGAALVNELGIKRDLVAQPLLNADAVGRQVAAETSAAQMSAGKPGLPREARSKESVSSWLRFHFPFESGQPGSVLRRRERWVRRRLCGGIPRCASICIACSIGIATRPLLLSSQ